MTTIIPTIRIAAQTAQTVRQRRESFFLSSALANSVLLMLLLIRDSVMLEFWGILQLSKGDRDWRKEKMNRVPLVLIVMSDEHYGKWHYLVERELFSSSSTT
jgi:hypothetical protein